MGRAHGEKRLFTPDLLKFALKAKETSSELF